MARFIGQESRPRDHTHALGHSHSHTALTRPRNRHPAEPCNDNVGAGRLPIPAARDLNEVAGGGAELCQALGGGWGGDECSDVFGEDFVCLGCVGGVQLDVVGDEECEEKGAALYVGRGGGWVGIGVGG